ncbi:hypothetical protein [Streptomyces hawaiiensis]|uniref:hypothetical protein n=1 Tax=Streptomyces hawaiiensis TaxID=67305 RepID=UPI001FE74935|nr:hypothetical protein [Streptomyces hawaiiensis]
MKMSTEGTEVRLPSTRLRPIASADVAGVVADAAQGEPSNGIHAVVGPEVYGLDRLGELTLAVKPDGRTVVTDESAGPFAGMPDVLTGDGSAHLASTRYEEWLKQS